MNQTTDASHVVNSRMAAYKARGVRADRYSASPQAGRRSPMSPTRNADASPTPAWRYRAGLSLFIIGNVATLTSLVVVPALGMNVAYLGATVIVGEVLVLSSVFFIGWRGMKELKGKMLNYLKRHPGAK
jgi:hypothetical protein